MRALLSSHCSSSLLFSSICRKLVPIRCYTRFYPLHPGTDYTMPISLQAHAFAGNPLKSRTPKPTDPTSPTLAFESLKAELLDCIPNHIPLSESSSSSRFKVLPFRNGKPLTYSDASDDGVGAKWQLGWMNLGECKNLLASSGLEMTEKSLVYLGSNAEKDTILWAIDFPVEDGPMADLCNKKQCFVELRTLMVATDWSDSDAMSDLAIAGLAKSMLEWCNLSRYCGQCGSQTASKDAGKRKVCLNEKCQKTIYPRVDPVVIMLVIDRQNDRVLLSRQSRFVPRMWSCLAGFVEPGESLEEAVRRETWEETGIEVEDVDYHSSQPWPVGPSGIPSQLMVGFFAYAKSFDLTVDKSELEDARWHSREEVQRGLSFAEYKKAQRSAAVKIDKICKGAAKNQNFASDFNVESGELSQMFVPGPFAIAHHLISSWVNQVSTVGGGARNASLSSL